MSGTVPPTTVDEVLALLKQSGNPRLREINARNGAGESQFGVKLGDIRAIAKRIKTNHELGQALWESGQVEAMFLATLIMKPTLLSKEDVERMTAMVTYGWLADWLMTNITRQHPAKEELRQRWMHSDHPWLARAGWSLTAERIAKSPEGLDLGALLDRIEREMPAAPVPAQWTMNFSLAETGIRYPELRERAIDIGERHGLYRDYPCSKGCVSPFAPIWIREMVARKG
jgi:3-methyladenine DNA glycosylase AlkD